VNRDAMAIAVGLALFNGDGRFVFQRVADKSVASNDVLIDVYSGFHCKVLIKKSPDIINPEN